MIAQNCQRSKSAQQCLAWFGSWRKPFDFTVQAWWSPWMLLVKDLSRWPNTWRKKRAALNIFWQIYRHMAKVHAKHSISQKKTQPAGKQKHIRKEITREREMRDWQKDVKIPGIRYCLVCTHLIYCGPIQILSVLNNHCHNKIEWRRETGFCFRSGQNLQLRGAEWGRTCPRHSEKIRLYYRGLAGAHIL